jgi:hypothetical protein
VHTKVLTVTHVCGDMGSLPKRVWRQSASVFNALFSREAFNFHR